MIVDQIDQGRLHVIAKPPAFRGGPAEVAAQEAECELLAQVTCDLRVADRPEQVAIYRPAVAQHQAVAGLLGAVRTALMRPENDGPERRNPAQPLVQV